MATLTNLIRLIDVENSNILNAEGRPSLAQLLSGTAKVRSDADEQLLINIVFKAQVKIKAIGIPAPDDEERPSVIKLFANQVCLFIMAIVDTFYCKSEF